jgi:mRNA-degrading endonuclease RelE of RelBE toxin-antitoxin system
MYTDKYSEVLVKKLKKIKKKDLKHYNIIRRKMDEILGSPHHSYKFLHYNMKSVNRVHIGHFVLVFIIDHKNKTISFEDYDHHDNIYL